MLSYAIKPYEYGAYEEGKAILKAIREVNDGEKAAARGGESSNSQKSYQQAQTNGAIGRVVGGYVHIHGALERNKPSDSASILKEERPDDKKSSG
ncbi:hypothetical protein sscle_15g106240 [Sclerotinia sclerotiorum 1980 UF-70]|uniref:Uncharacterized protein n=1 Tax=Sclerotinia sclerotiorum (strain ATCC 18683 / 1980 / Ss-1) TaxID=665079 RepID=A0A1D9QLP2_SCLS1|nr:hypothetical protein sscle_15g106240 [Sclerotinia sclerotiorum 1980 UF-70]